MLPGLPAAGRVLRQRARPKVLGRRKLRGVTITLVEDERTREEEEAEEETEGERGT